MDDQRPAPEAPTAPDPDAAPDVAPDDPLRALGRRLTLAAALDRALVEDALRVDLPREEATAAGLDAHVERVLGRMGEDERTRRINRALRLLDRVEQIATAAAARGAA